MVKTLSTDVLMAGMQKTVLASSANIGNCISCCFQNVSSSILPLGTVKALYCSISLLTYSNNSMYVSLDSYTRNML